MWICCASTIRESKNTPQAHLENFYHDFEQVRGNNYDGMIITGAPLGLVEFEEVVYWPRIVEIIEWSHQHVTSTLFLCWAVQAALKALYGMEKQTHGEKLSGVYRHHRLDEHEPLLRGFDDEFVAPALPLCGI